MAVSIERLTQARETMLRVVRERPDGRRYIPLVLHLEREIAALRGLDDDYARILRDAA